MVLAREIRMPIANAVTANMARSESLMITKCAPVHAAVSTHAVARNAVGTRSDRAQSYDDCLLSAAALALIPANTMGNVPKRNGKRSQADTTVHPKGNVPKHITDG